jgi:hypothetical protein
MEVPWDSKIKNILGSSGIINGFRKGSILTINIAIIVIIRKGTLGFGFIFCY